MKIATVLAVILFASIPLSAQNKVNIFPQVADGIYPDGTYYTSAFMIIPWSQSLPAFTCALRLNGLSINLNNVGRDTLFTILIPANGGYFVGVTAADQSARTGYAVLTCSEYVYAQALYSYYAANGTKLGEATVFAVDGDFNGLYGYRLIADQRGGSQLGIAIANDTDLEHTYRLSINGLTTTVVIPARSSLARFLTEILPNSKNTFGVLVVDTMDSSAGFYPMGLRYTGSVFTTIPAN